MRSRPRIGSVVRLLILSASIVSGAHAQCAFDWSDGFSSARVSGGMYALRVFDDGTGNGAALYAAGSFSVNGGATQTIGKWNGSAWSSLGTGILNAGPDNVSVYALTVYDDGSGPALIAGGTFSSAGGMPANDVARWNGTAWSPLGNGITVGAYGLQPRVFALTVFDDGSGPALYAGGIFTEAGGVPAGFVARWDGTSWSALGSGVEGAVNALVVHDDGSGPRLYAGGAFTVAGGAAANYIARWDGTNWTPLGAGVNGEVRALTVFDDGPGGNGPKLVAGGDFTVAGTTNANRIARWNGTDWSRLDTGVNASVLTLSVLQDGTPGGPKLYAGGSFTTASNSPASRIARWNGISWSAVDGATLNGWVSSLVRFDDNSGAGSVLYVGGGFSNPNGVETGGIAKLQGNTWSALGHGRGFDATLASLGASVRALTEADDGSGGGSALFAAGQFMVAGDVLATHIAKWNGSSWLPLGAGLGINALYQIDEVMALTEFDDGSGPALYASGNFRASGSLELRHIARWKNGSWSALGTGLLGSGGSLIAEANALVVFDDGTGSALYVGGKFESAGGVDAHNIAKWDGSTWSAVAENPLQRIFALGVFDEGTGNGPQLFAGGNSSFGNSGLTRLDGSVWTTLTDTNSNVVALEVFDDGSGPALFAGGEIYYAGGPGFVTLAKWTSAGWSSLAGGLPNIRVNALDVFDDGTGGGSALYAGGYFTSIGGSPASRIARWNGQTWSTLGSGVDQVVYALHGTNAGGDPKLFVGGDFKQAGGHPSLRIAAWQPTCPGTPFCFGDGSISPCPCGNSGAPGRGCANSSNANGALLATSGSTNPDTVVLTKSGSGLSVLTIYFKGNAQVGAGIVFGDGLRCAAGSLIRFGAQNSVNGVSVYPGPGQPSLSSVSGTPPGSGTTAYYQAFYRDSSAPFCPPATFNGSNGVKITW